MNWIEVLYGPSAIRREVGPPVPPRDVVAETAAALRVQIRAAQEKGGDPLLLARVMYPWEERDNSDFLEELARYFEDEGYILAKVIWRGAVHDVMNLYCRPSETWHSTPAQSNVFIEVSSRPWRGEEGRRHSPGSPTGCERGRYKPWPSYDGGYEFKERIVLEERGPRVPSQLDKFLS